MKIAVLTSSRADYGIYLPLLRAMKADPFFNLRLIAFGTHLSEAYGNTVELIEKDGFTIDHRIEVMPANDSPDEISAAIGRTTQAFSHIWSQSKYDLVLALGDRFEMFAAVVSGVPFNIRFGHIHGGETTLGAIDDAFRHSITLMSSVHFACAEAYKERIIQIRGDSNLVFNTGALSIDLLASCELMKQEEFMECYGVDLSQPTILSTLHPETVSYEKNILLAEAFAEALLLLPGFQLVITMPNADTFGKVIREKLQQLKQLRKGVHLFENLGSIGYLSCMKYAKMLIGNTSSGFYDASYFPKWVINLGVRQKGRIRTPNIIDLEFNPASIAETARKIAGLPVPEFEPVYGKGDAAAKMIKILKNEFTTH